MKPQNWVRITPEDQNDGSCRDAGEEDRALVRGVWGLDGAQYPRLGITIWAPGTLCPQEVQGFLICSNYKEDADAWWESGSHVGFPPELIDTLHGMLLEAKAKWESRQQTV